MVYRSTRFAGEEISFLREAEEQEAYEDQLHSTLDPVPEMRIGLPVHARFGGLK